MKTYLLILVVLLACSSICRAEQKPYSLADDLKLTIDMTIAIMGGERNDLVQYFQNSIREGMSVIITLEGHTIVWKSEKDIPYGDVYCGKGKWLVKYEKNHGYMPIWVGNK